MESKSALRSIYWDALKEAGAARFPGVRGRIPNFTGAEAAAARLAGLDAFRNATCLKCNPDLPQRPVRHAALKAGKVVYLAVPKLAGEFPFIALDPAKLGEPNLWKASSIKGATTLGEPISLEALPVIDLIVTGCVAVTREGARLGKGGGYSDLELGLLRQAGKVGPDITIATTVHASQVAPDGQLPIEAHDTTLDLIVTPDEIVQCPRPWGRPDGILWEVLDDEKRDAIPVLARAPRLEA